ncbi:putative odorant receptor 85e [Schistocerca gregaria]|uniref:putative odorant receptor 85e n=1 Tax=Schistocerca gregaria TaxID=7010 RepID=UPI00211EA3F4|nr:putative odorant receptor 85e [Schistocerca gregaria]
MSDDLGELLGPVAAALRLLGLQAPSTSWSLTWRALLLLVVNASVPAMAASKLWVAPAAKLEELAVEVFVCVTGVAMTVKVAAFLWQQEQTQRLAVLLADCRRRFVCSGGGPGDTRARYRRHIRRIVVYMQVMVVVPTTLWLLDPLVGAGSSAGRLPMPMWVPPGLRSSPGHQILYAFQALAMITVVEASLYLDVCFVVLMLSVSAELHVLNDAVASIKAPAVLRPALYSASYRVTNVINGSWLRCGLSSPRGAIAYNGHQSTEERTESSAIITDDANGIGTEMYRVLVKSIKHHQAIIRCVEELESVMSQSVFVLLFLNMMNICVHIFVTSVLLQKDVERTTMSKMLCTLPIYMYETGLYCIFGQTIIDQGEQLTASAFSGDWPEGDARMRKALLVLMLRSSKPLKLTVGKLYVLSRHTFLQILNGSYTLFNMLYQVQTKK